MNLSQLLRITEFLHSLGCWVDMVKKIVVVMVGVMVVTIEMLTAMEMGMMAGAEIEMKMDTEIGTADITIGDEDQKASP